MVTKSRLLAALAALGWTLGIAGDGWAQQTVVPVATFKTVRSDAEVAQLCNFTAASAKLQFNSPNSSGASTTAPFAATISLAGNYITIDDTTPTALAAEHDQYLDITAADGAAAGGMEAVQIKVGNDFNVFCFINAGIANMATSIVATRNNFNFAIVYWATPLCPVQNSEDLATILALIQPTFPTTTGNLTIPAQSGIIFHQLGGNQMQLGCGFPPNAIIRCDERSFVPPTNNNFFNFLCFPAGAKFAGAPATNHVDVELPLPPVGPGAPPIAAAVTYLYASQKCTTVSGGSSTKFTQCMALYGF